jgi:hypothetical protein
MRNLRLFLVLATLMGVAACASPPQAAVDTARSALNVAARNPDVVTYAPDALRAAQEKMQDLDAEMAAQAKRSALSRNYDAAQTLATEALQHATDAVSASVSAKAQVAADAAALVEELTAALPAFQSKVWAARRVARIRMDIITPLQAVPDQIRTGIADAQKDIDAGTYATAKAKLTSLKDLMKSAEESITEQTRIARGR